MTRRRSQERQSSFIRIVAARPPVHSPSLPPWNLTRILLSTNLAKSKMTSFFLSSRCGCAPSVLCCLEGPAPPPPPPLPELGRPPPLPLLPPPLLLDEPPRGPPRGAPLPLSDIVERRVGFVVGNAQGIKGLGQVKTNVDSGVFKAIQKAAIAAYSTSEADLQALMSVYQKRRDIIVQGLQSLGFPIEPPLATLYIWVPVPPGYTSTEFVTMLLDQGRGRSI